MEIPLTVTRGHSSLKMLRSLTPERAMLEVFPEYANYLARSIEVGRETPVDRRATPAMD
jgi:hypothetical protein